ncbi:beach domain-containing protein [Anaeramoeba flamelloides]|uniref:Beach domain-containing protein n=1 Tax=Anaeramoeba flamelloides TaxID=1746091 RepID=A0ABQ8XZ55_9EUKA|nr:beach domain-containing protein [Anaeramoeba flamelloides]
MVNHSAIKLAFLDQIEGFGQCPTQLFFQPHPVKNNIRSVQVKSENNNHHEKNLHKKEDKKKEITHKIIKQKEEEQKKRQANEKINTKKDSIKKNEQQQSKNEENEINEENKKGKEVEEEKAEKGGVEKEGVEKERVEREEVEKEEVKKQGRKKEKKKIKKENDEKDKGKIFLNCHKIETNFLFSIKHGIGDIQIQKEDNKNEKIVCVQKKRLLIPLEYNKFIDWSFPDNSLRVLNNNLKLILIKEKPHYGKISVSTISSNGKYLLTAGHDLIINIWKLTPRKKIQNENLKHRKKIKQKLIERCYGHQSIIKTMDISIIYSIFISGDQEKNCFLWDLQKARIIRKLGTFQSQLTKIQINQYNGDIFTCAGKEMKLWTINGKLIAHSPSYSKNNISQTEKIISSVICPVDHLKIYFYFITGYNTGKIKFWKNIKNKRKKKSNNDTIYQFKLIWSSQNLGKGPVTALCLTKDKKKLYYSIGNKVSYLSIPMTN